MFFHSHPNSGNRIALVEHANIRCGGDSLKADKFEVGGRHNHRSCDRVTPADSILPTCFPINGSVRLEKPDSASFERRIMPPAGKGKLEHRVIIERNNAVSTSEQVPSEHPIIITRVPVGVEFPKCRADRSNECWPNLVAKIHFLLGRQSCSAHSLAQEGEHLFDIYLPK